jgi:putative hydrolase of the HAD superfamily
MKADVIIFDLDDTLYEEMSFVRSGFRAVASFLQREVPGAQADLCYAWMMDELARNGRGRVFDAVLERLGSYTRRGVIRCVQVYRKHSPDIRLFPDAIRVLQTLKGRPMYIVTDGNPLVQAAKLRAMGLNDGEVVRKCYLTRRYGLHHEKPSPFCFLRILEREMILPERAVYVGDNPHKDFVGIKPLGFRTVRVMRGAYRSVVLDDAHEAETKVENLDEFLNWLSDD